MVNYEKVKNCLDILIAIILLIPSILICIIAGILIKLDSKGKIIFKHKRVGKNGKTIYVYKLRTMVENAEQEKSKFTEKQKQEFLEKYKLENDPRITKMGKKLRRFSIDEIPQIFNVLKGELSIVGPRPITKEELKEKYGSEKQKLLKVKPGIVGAWTANGRSNTTYEKRKELELEYVKNMNFKTDVKILIKTVGVIIKRQGAM